MNKFSLKYLAKFICEADAEAVSINGLFMPIKGYQHNMLQEVDLSDKGLFSEDLFVLSKALKDNASVTKINLSKNMIGFTYVDERTMLEMKLRNQDKLNDGTFDKLFYDSLGLEHFNIAFKDKDTILQLDLSENDIGSENFLILLPIFESNINIKVLDLADCSLDGSSVEALCVILKQNNANLKELMFRNSPLCETGAHAIADLIKGHPTLRRLEIFGCKLGDAGGNAIGAALRANFCIEDLSIGDNGLQEGDAD